MPAFQLAVGLRVIGTGPDMGDPGQADELLEVAGDELRAVIADDARLWRRDISRSARWTMVSTSCSVMASRISQCTM